MKCTVKLKFEEFTSLCPITGQPDFGRLEITYQPHLWLIESKALKVYLFSYRNYGCFGETICGMICQHLYNVLKPNSISVGMWFSPRGGIPIEIHVEAGNGS